MPCFVAYIGFSAKVELAVGGRVISREEGSYFGRSIARLPEGVIAPSFTYIFLAFPGSYAAHSPW